MIQGNLQTNPPNPHEKSVVQPGFHEWKKRVEELAQKDPALRILRRLHDKNALTEDEFKMLADLRFSQIVVAT